MNVSRSQINKYIEDLTENYTICIKLKKNDPLKDNTHHWKWCDVNPYGKKSLLYILVLL